MEDRTSGTARDWPDAPRAGGGEGGSGERRPVSTAPFEAPGFPAVSTHVPLSQPPVCGRHFPHGTRAGRQQRASQ